MKVELDWLKKKLAISVEAKRQLVELAHSRMSLRRQCALLGLSRSGLYYAPGGESSEDVELMRLLDEQYTATPGYGIRRMMAWLRSRGYAVNHKRIRRLLRTMGLEAIYPKPRLSQPAEGHTISPYLLPEVTVSRSNQVWSTDITYARLQSGFIYLVAVMDWFSRDVLAGAVSITLDVHFCLAALDHALSRRQPEIFNTDQAAQFTSRAFTARLQPGGICISMDGRGRALDNVVVERLWRKTVKDEEVDLRAYQSVWDARQPLARYWAFYNEERLPQALGYRTPAAVYHGYGRAPQLARAKNPREALEPNLCCPQNGLDNGVHLSCPANGSKTIKRLAVPLRSYAESTRAGCPGAPGMGTRVSATSGWLVSSPHTCGRCGSSGRV